MSLGSGCERDEGIDSDRLDRAEEHAAIFGENRASEVLVVARDAVLTHPESDRQRQSRQLLLELQKMEDQMPDEPESEERHDERRRNEQPQEELR